MSKHALWWPGDARVHLPQVEKSEWGALAGAPVASTLDFAPKVQGLEHDLVTLDYIREANDLLKAAWPAMHAQAEEILTRVYPVRYADGKRWSSGGSYGTRSSNLEHMGQVYATTDTVLGFVEGIVASLGNWKLYDAGITLTSWQKAGLFTNADNEMCKIPLRDERQAPIGTVLHATYAAMHMVAFYRGVVRVDMSIAASERLLLCRARLLRGWTALSEILNPPIGDHFVKHLDDVVDELLNADG
jgi:hypothetical protein